MPQLIETTPGDAIGLADLVDALEEMGLIPGDPHSLAAAAPMLRRLSENRSFLGDIAISELKSACAGQIGSNRYSSQVMMLHKSTSGYFIRANFWPSEVDSIYRRSGADHFFYGKAHDHNFHFLTVGHLGPGYWSDYYEHDGTALAGYAGERARLRFIERSALHQGKVMLYRAHTDIHSQWPADQFSVSLNIMQQTPDIAWRNQYLIDIEAGCITSVPTFSQTEAMLKLAASFGGGNGRDLAQHFLERHPVDRVRLSAAEALASAAPSRNEMCALWARLESSASTVLRESARARRAALAAA